VIRALVLSHEVAELANSRARLARLTLAAHQEHALRVATLARTIAGGGALADDAFLAGVLHDVGELVLAAQRPEWLTQAATLAGARRIPLHEAEAELFGVSHAEVGAYLVGLWGLPFRIVEAVAHHHVPSRAGPSRAGPSGVLDTIAAVHVAAALVAEVEGAAAPLDQSYVESLGITTHLARWRAAGAA
jgi:HD-like signal output (HDOD) protein